MKNSSITDVMRQADELTSLGQADEAVQCYQQWLTAVAEDELPYQYIAWFNMGVLLRSLGQIDEAITAYQTARLLKPDFYQAAVNLGLAQEAKGMNEAAIQTWLAALQPIDAQTTLLNHLGRCLESMRQFQQAEAMLERSLLLNPKQPDAIQHFLPFTSKTMSMAYH
ncbi:tetratricopeptide repeat protein [Methylocucumis oryzae]|uniref:tetratricopeptide repeat protein n=1 Tax=Methylocucumis oryzae TaxID=1632867 RepID=UPI000697B1FB|nr:tetratricopeptide repeat protein [Methylocucumis oryzae]